MVMFTFSVLDRKYTFWADLVQKIKIAILSSNLVTTISDKIDTRCFHKNVSKKYLTFSKIPKIPSSLWLNIVPSLKNLYATVLARNKQANLQPT